MILAEDQTKISAFESMDALLEGYYGFVMTFWIRY